MSDTVHNAQSPSIADCANGAEDCVTLLDMRKTPAERLRAIRESKGYENASEAARAMGAKITTYLHHEGGIRPLSRKAAVRYGAFFSIPAGHLLYGEGQKPQSRVALSGVVMNYGAVSRQIPDPPIPRDVIAPPITGEELVCLAVVDDTMFPAYRAGDVVYCRITAPGETVTDMECMIELPSGERMLRYVIAQPNGLFTISMHTSTPRVDVEIASAAPVVWVHRRALDLKSLST